MWRQLQIWGHFYLFFFHYVCFPTDFFSSTNNWSSKPHYHFGVFVCLIHSMNFCWKTSFLILFFNKLIKLEFITFILKFIRNFLSHLFSNGIFVLFISICSDGVFFFFKLVQYVFDNVWWHIYAIQMQCLVLVDLVVNRDGEDKKIIILLSFRRKVGFLFDSF